MKKLFFILAVSAVFALSGCTSSCSEFAGEPITKEFEIEGAYTGLDVSSAFTVTVSDKVDKVIVTAGEKVMPNVLVEMEGNTLRIHLKPLTHSFMSKLEVLLPHNAGLTDLRLSGASDFISAFGLTGQKVTVSLSGASDCDCDLSGEEIEMECSGASDFKGKVTASFLNLDLSGDSDAELRGEVDRLKIDLSGASDIEKTIVDQHYGLVCNQCEGSLSGASDAFLHCDGNIALSISGASSLHYTGNATTGDCSTSGGSSIRHDAL